MGTVLCTYEVFAAGVRCRLRLLTTPSHHGHGNIGFTGGEWVAIVCCLATFIREVE